MDRNSKLAALAEAPDGAAFLRLAEQIRPETQPALTRAALRRARQLSVLDIFADKLLARYSARPAQEAASPFEFDAVVRGLVLAGRRRSARALVAASDRVEAAAWRRLLADMAPATGATESARQEAQT